MHESKRIFYKKLTPADLPWLIEMRSPDAVNRFLGGPDKQNAEALAVRLKHYIECYDTFGFGFCAMVLKETGVRIGTSGLMPLEDTGEIEVGYNLSERFWRHGYATEAARAWLRYGFGTAGLERIVAVAHPDNTNSWRIMEKCAMTFQGNERHWGIDCVVYAISRAEYLESISTDLQHEHS